MKAWCILRTMPRFYDTAEWDVARRQALHDTNYTCQRCGVSLVGKGKAAIVHHRKELKRAPALRSEPLNLEPQCTECHNRTHADIKRGMQRGCDEQGRPLDPSHPWAKAT